MRSGWCRVSILILGLSWAPLCPLPGRAQTAAKSLPSKDATLAYQAKEAHQLERAATLFEHALAADPGNVALRKDFAYTLLSIGRTERARDEFGAVLKRDPQDSYTALEYAFLCHETGQLEEAWLLFRDLRGVANQEHRATAAKTFSTLDAELSHRISRLQAATRQDPGNYSSHLELARTLSIRHEYARAAEEFEKAYRLKPDYVDVLLELSAALRKAGKTEMASAVVLTASRSASAFVAEQAKALLPDRYPYLSEFESALHFEPAQPALRREMGFFLLSLGREREAQLAFEALVRAEPTDLVASAQLGFLLLADGKNEDALPLLKRAARSEDAGLRQRVAAALSQIGNTSGIASPPVPATFAMGMPEDALSQDFADAATAREMGQKSYDNGFVPDAIRYFEEAHRLDPTNFDTMLRLAWSLNLAKRDDEALRWFGLAARSPDPAIAGEARAAIRNLSAPSASPAGMAAVTERSDGVSTSFWAMPLHSTRWGSTFSYAQAKVELQRKGLPLVPYLSLRFVGDSTGAVGSANPQFLSENAFILGLGARSRPWKGVLLWGEAGTTMAYLSSRREATGSFLPDYRGGLSHFKQFGPSILNNRPGSFVETMNDLVYIHRFDRDTLAISRNRVGWHLGKLDSLGGLQFQTFLNLNANTDFKRQAWANFVEAGPGLRFRWAWMPPSVSLTLNYLRGHHTIRRVDSRPNTYSDFQAGFWYAITR